MTETPELSRLIREAMPAHVAPEHLHAWARDAARAASTNSPTLKSADVSRAPSRTRRVAQWKGLAYAAGIIAAALIGYGAHGVRSAASARHTAEDGLVMELLDNHVESLVSGRLMDVQSTDQHTVKPWFAGKIDFAPRVPQLEARGYPLLGGRLGFLQGRRVAVLVYGYRKHVINVFVWRDSASTSATPPAISSHAGYSAVRWNAGGLTHWAIADTGPAELAAFRTAFAAE